MDNFFIDVVSEGSASLEAALGLAFKQHQRATHYAIINGALVFFWVSPLSDKQSAGFPATCHVDGKGAPICGERFSLRTLRRRCGHPGTAMVGNQG